jgi:hypothetical protein
VIPCCDRLAAQSGAPGVAHRRRVSAHSKLAFGLSTQGDVAVTIVHLVDSFLSRLATGIWRPSSMLLSSRPLWSNCC